ncbi:MAG: hypothetical protein WC821_03830 [archaeon]
MFDKNFDEPNYSPGGYNEPVQGGFSMPSFGGPEVNFDFKKFVPIIIAIILVLVIGFFVLSWLGSQQTITINLKTPDNQMVEGKIILKSSDGKTVAFTPKGDSSEFTATLWPGEYRITATADGYKPVLNKTFTVPIENKQLDLNISRDLDAALNASADYTEIYQGQIITGKLNILNSGAEFNAADIIPIASTQLQATTIIPANTVVGPGGNINIDFNVKLKEGLTIAAAGVANSLSFRIKGTNITSNKLELKALPSVTLAETNITGNLVFATLTAGETYTKAKIIITNPSKTLPMKNVLISILPNEGDDDKLDWFEFSQGNAEAKNTITIDVINPSEKKELSLFITPSMTANKGDAFTGYLSVQTFSIKAEVRKNVVYTVSTAKTVGVELVGTTKLTAQCPKLEEACKTISLINDLQLVNIGNTKIPNITVQIDFNDPTSSPYCPQFITPQKQPLITLEPRGAAASADKASLPMEININKSIGGTEIGCRLKWSYYSELDGVVVTNGKLIEITKSLSSS